MDWRRSITWTMTFASGLLVYASSLNAYQARSSAVISWSSPCQGDYRNWWDTMCNTWRKTLGSKGWSQWYANYSTVTVSRYTDPKFQSWGYDNASNGFDAGTAAILCTHGFYDYRGWWGLMQQTEHNMCGLSVAQMDYGKLSGGTTRFLHLSSCNSMRWNYTNSWFGPSAGGVHVISGFHGIMYIGSSYVTEYQTMVNDSFSGTSVAESWVDNMHHDPIIGHTICPISMAFGPSADAALSRLHTERYNFQTADTNNGYGVLQWVGGCDPDDGDPLPN